MQLTGSSEVEDFLTDWVAARPEPDARLPVSCLGDREVAAELARIQRNRARETAREAELILRLAELRPDADDPPPGIPGTRAGSWRTTESELPGVSEFLPDEVAHAINLGRGTAAFRTRRAWTWRGSLPATFAALRRGEIDERRAGVLADALQHTAPELARAVEAALPDPNDLSLAALRRQALELLAELDDSAIDERHEHAKRSADVRAYDTGNGMATLSGDMPAEEAAACYDVIDQLAAMAKADGDPRPIGQIRAAIHSMLILRPADSGLPGITVNLAVTATLEGLEGASTVGGQVNGFPISAARLRDLLRRLGALGLTTPEGGHSRSRSPTGTGGCWPPSPPPSWPAWRSGDAPITPGSRARAVTARCWTCRHPPTPISPPRGRSDSSPPGIAGAACPTAGSGPAGPTSITSWRTLRVG